MKGLLFFVIFIVCIAACHPDQPKVHLRFQQSQTNSLLQAVSIVNEDTVWVSGHRGTWARTKDGGRTWEANTVSRFDTLQFRDVHAFSYDEAILMSAGTGAYSKIFRTQDGGNSWDIVFDMNGRFGFLDCLDFWKNGAGLAFSDPDEGAFLILKTQDFGRSWTALADSILPTPEGSEASFAASGTCVKTYGDGMAWIGTGAGVSARILISTDYGNSWKTYETPIETGQASGITSTDTPNGKMVLVAGGDISQSNPNAKKLALSKNGGQTWDLIQAPVLGSAFYGAHLGLINKKPFVVLSSPQGLAYSFNLGKTWGIADTSNYWAVDFSTDGNIGWAVGRQGRIAKIRIQ